MNNEFAHYGIKGMKWGIRKKREPVRKHYLWNSDRIVWGKSGANRIAKKMAKGQSHARAEAGEWARLGGSTVTGIAGGMLAYTYWQNPQAFKDSGKRLVNTILGAGAKVVIYNENGDFVGKRRKAGVEVVNKIFGALGGK